MIIDRLDNWDLLLARLSFVRDFLLALPADAPDGRYALRGEDAFALVFSYDTKPRLAGMVETHDRYVDIQSLLAGSERVEWFPRHRLWVETPYDPARDATFYAKPAEPAGSFLLEPGLFAAFFPPDGHLTQLQVAAPEAVRKVVVKAALRLVVDG